MSASDELDGVGRDRAVPAGVARFVPMRRSSIEVSEAPHSRSSILIVSHPKTDFNKKINCLPVTNPMAKVY